MAALLVVDDDDTIRDMLYDLFSDEHLCHAARTAEQALGWLDTEEYDVVITDISMPGLSGVELFAHIQQRQPETPVIIISGISYQQQPEELLKMGAFDYFVKPVRLEQLENGVVRALSLRRALVESVRKRTCET